MTALGQQYEDPLTTICVSVCIWPRTSCDDSGHAYRRILIYACTPWMQRLSGIWWGGVAQAAVGDQQSHPAMAQQQTIIASHLHDVLHAGPAHMVQCVTSAIPCVGCKQADRQHGTMWQLPPCAELS